MRRWTLDELIRPVATRMDPALISPVHMERIMGIARHLPGTLSSRIGFECPLGTPDPRADLLILMRPVGSERETLAGMNAAHPFSPAGNEDNAWRRIQTIASEWLQPGSALSRDMSNIWLEFDVDDEAESGTLPMEPNVFLGPAEGVNRESHYGPWLTDDALPRLIGAPLSAGVAKKLDACVAAQPAGTCMTHVGAMMQRPAAALRLVVSYIKPEDVPPYLERIGWRGPLSEVDALLRRFFHLPDFLLLDLDVGADVLPRIGIEGMFIHPPALEPRWGRWLADLEAGGLCLPEKRRALEAFPGWMDDVHHRDIWPEALLQASAMLGSRSVSAIFLSLHHIKVVFEAGRPVMAKGYIGAGTQWVKPQWREAE